MDTVIVGHGVNDRSLPKGAIRDYAQPARVWPYLATLMIRRSFPSQAAFSDPDRDHFAQNNECAVGTIYLAEEGSESYNLYLPLLCHSYLWWPSFKYSLVWKKDKGFRHLVGCSDLLGTTRFLTVPGYRPGANAGGEGKTPRQRSF